MQIKDITPGESWACRFRATTFLDESGAPVLRKNLAVGEAHPGKPGEYESIGVIQVRDAEKELVTVVDVNSDQEFVVDWNNCWDVDRVEWINE